MKSSSSERIFLALALVVLSFLGSVSNANTVQCRPMVEEATFNPKPPNLYEYYRNDIRGKSDIRIMAENRETLKVLHETIPPQNPRRSQAISINVAYDILEVVNKHPVVGRGARERYKRDGVEIGYCFGRAMYIHLLLLKMGVQKESIRKVWAVGPTRTPDPNVNWGHHISIMVFTKEKGWVTIDTNEVKPQAIQSWSSTYFEKSIDKLLKLYITEPEKFGIETAKYNPVNLGFKLDRESDWYRHYFVDMLKAIKQETLESLGLKKLIPSENQIEVDKAYKPPRRPETLREKFLDTFWVFN
jgi:hypothetical protein